MTASFRDFDAQETTAKNSQEQVCPDLHQPEVHKSLERYWYRNVLLTLVLLVIWAAVGLGCGVLLADWFNQYKLIGTGFPLGFWFAHQGSIVIFVLLILIYCIAMNRLDALHHAELKQIKKGRPKL